MDLNFALRLLFLQNFTSIHIRRRILHFEINILTDSSYGKIFSIGAQIQVQVTFSRSSIPDTFSISFGKVMVILMDNYGLALALLIRFVPSGITDSWPTRQTAGLHQSTKMVPSGMEISTNFATD